MRAALRLLYRALRLRCPACGRGALFSSWFRMRRHCPRCGLRPEREEGYYTGALAFNLIGTELSVMGSLVIALVATWPNPPWQTLWYGSIVAAILLPLVTYPFSKTLWLAFDLYFRPADAADFEPGNSLDGKVSPPLP